MCHKPHRCRGRLLLALSAAKRAAQLATGGAANPEVHSLLVRLALAGELSESEQTLVRSFVTYLPPVVPTFSAQRSPGGDSLSWIAVASPLRPSPVLSLRASRPCLPLPSIGVMG